MSIGKSVRPDNAGQLGLEDTSFLDLTLGFPEFGKKQQSFGVLVFIGLFERLAL
jgi:hypothetical protein